ncbi:MAG: hypothetical protein KDK44_00460 [Chlamydiia bacterium]|nr:hypothetical protein [Chlamydiia bacterium]HPE84835.1 hypothetical protein [Chlamydiales bacterium]
MKKYVILLVVSITSQCLAVCPACVKRRAAMMANRPTIETVLPSYIDKCAAIDHVYKCFENGEYQDFLETMRQEYQKAVKKIIHQRLLATRNVKRPIRMHLARSTIDTFLAAPAKLETLKAYRADQFKNLYTLNHDTYLGFVLEFLSHTGLSEEQIQRFQIFANRVMTSLAQASPLEKKLISIDREFWLSIYLLNLKSLRTNRTELDQVGIQCLVLDFERLRQMEMACLAAGDEPFAKVIADLNSALPDLAKQLLWESFLQNAAADCFKLPEKIDQEFVDIQKEYMKQRAECIRKDRELLAFG